jgi:hypothetical protein
MIRKGEADILERGSSMKNFALGGPRERGWEGFRRIKFLFPVALAVLYGPSLAIGDDAALAKVLRDKGAIVTETNGVATTVNAADCSKWAEEDFGKVGQLTHLKSLSLGAGLGDAALALLTGLTELEYFSTNLSTITDEGVKSFAPLKKLKILKFFHPSKAFTGAGLAQLAELPNLERLTVAGSLAFGDEGMAAVGKLTNLKEVRTWHAGQTLEGIKELRSLKNLKSLTLGQRLAYKPPTSLSDETIPILAEIKSLESLQLEEARLKFDALVQLKQLPELKKLNLEGIDIPETDIERLRKELPKVEVKWSRPNETYTKRIQQLFGAQ